MKCSACGSSVSDRVQFCTECGVSLRAGQRALAGVAGDSSYGFTAPYLADRDPLIGLTIDGKYRVDALLGQGGMGRVYRATRPLIGDTVAVKILSPEQVGDNIAVERFRREAQAAARLRHPNAVSIYDFGVSDEGLVYLVMEMVEGQSLRAVIKQQGPLTPNAASEIFNQVCSALDEAHKQNIIHRDIKPDNIIVNANATGLRVKVLDFGIAKLRDLAPSATNLTQTGSVVGTPHYMSPEQCLGEELDHRSDIYSLGVVLYESLTGILPFNSPTSAAVVVQQVTQQPPPLRSINLSISQPVEAVVLHALQKRREDRPQTACNLAQELSAAVQGLGYAASGAVTGAITASAMPANNGGGLAPTVQMSVAAIPSGSMTPQSLPLPSGTHASQWPAAEAPAASKGKRMAIAICLAAAAIIAVAVVVFLNLSSTKKTVLAEIKKGNLVRPQGSSAYDLYSNNKSGINESDKTEIANEAIPALEKRGEEILSQLRQDANETEQEWDEASRIYSWLNDLKPKPLYEARRYFALGSLVFLKEDYPKALTNYQRSVDLDSSWALSLNRLGRTYLRLKDKDKARQFYERATAAEPGWINPWINLGYLCWELSDYTASETAMQRALEIDPAKASAHYLLGQLFEKRDLWCDAVQHYQQAIDNAYNTSSVGFKVDTAKNRLEKIRWRCMGD
jgi:tetratricopeptide (TPR) repeat protein/tRNA A-37 threonylcarbamoyl transferase component Bud32